MGNMEQLTHEIKVLVEKGDHAKEKARQFYVAAGQHLKTLRDSAPSQKVWVQLLKEKCDLNKTRAYELIQIADGLTTVEKVRADTNKRKAKHRARPFRNGQPDSDESVAINRLAYRLIQLDIGLARELNRILRQGSAERLADVLDAGIEIEESATNRGGRDPGPIPDFLDRNRVGGMN